PLHGQTLFCPGVTVVDTLGVAPGFDAYQWRQNGNLLSATGNQIIVNTYGTYDCRVQRNGIWSDWSHTPVVIGIKQPTITPPITIAGLASNVIPALDNPGVTLQLPAGYATYAWQKVGNNTTLSTTNTLKVTTPGQYIAEVTETGGCSANWGSPFTVIAANGPNPPDPASGVLAAALSQTSVLLNWNQNPSPAYNETGFEIYQGTKSGGPYKLVAITKADASTDTITGLNAATKYFWVIRAVDSTGASATSNEASATTIADVQPPTAPGNLAITGTSYSGVSLQWTASTDNVGVVAYDIYVNGVRLYSVTPDKTSFTVYSLKNGASYTFYVKARDLAGNASNPSNQVSGEPLINGLTYSYFDGLATTLKAIPDYSSMTPIQTGTISTFSLSPAYDPTYFGFLFQGYLIAPTTGTYQFQTTSDDGSRLYLGSAGALTSPYSFSGTPLINNDGLHGSTSKQSGLVNLVAGQIYPIAATYLQMTGGFNLTVSWKTPGSGSFVSIPASAFMQTSINNGSAPAAPSNLVATTVSYKAISLTWKDNANNETGYEIYRSTDSIYTTAAIIGNAPAGATSYTDSSAAASTRYYYQVRAINQYGASALISNYREARFQFNNTLVDSSNNHTITPTGTVTYDAVNKQEGAASLKLNGSNQAETLNSTGGFLQNAFNQRTVALWIKAASFGSNRVIFDIGGSTNGLALVMNNNTLTAAVASGGTRTSITYSYGSNTNWNHVAVVYLGDTLQLYVNGVLVASNNALSFHSIATTTDGSRLGQTNGTCALNNASGIFAGNLDDFGIFDAALGPHRHCPQFPMLPRTSWLQQRAALV
ncbi:MAG: fibronectin type III domain-containing protein, partial [Sphingobacteriales bacterium]|nr:fibronectin type III domain-containing protein [Sphingobacteriales bacterium]